MCGPSVGIPWQVAKLRVFGGWYRVCCPSWAVVIYVTILVGSNWAHFCDFFLGVCLCLVDRVGQLHGCGLHFVLLLWCLPRGDQLVLSQKDIREVVVLDGRITLSKGAVSKSKCWYSKIVYIF